MQPVLRVAHKWGYLPKMPRIRMVKEPQKLVRYVTPEYFSPNYAACDAAKRPTSDVYSPADWWRAFLTFLYMTPDETQVLSGHQEVHQHGPAVGRRCGATPRAGVSEGQMIAMGGQGNGSRLPAAVSSLAGGRAIRKSKVECLWSVARLQSS